MDKEPRTDDELLHAVWSMAGDAAADAERYGSLDLRDARRNPLWCAFVDWINELERYVVPAYSYTDTQVAVRFMGFVAGWRRGRNE